MSDPWADALLVFGTVVFEEADLLNKVDDIGFLVIGAVALTW